MNPPATRTAVADPPRRGSWSTLCHAPQKPQNHKKTPAGPVSLTPSRLSRYPTRTAPAVPGHPHTRARPPAAATNPPRWRAGPILASYAPWQTVGELEPTIRLDPQMGQARLTTRGSAAETPLWPLPGSSVGEADGIGRHPQEPHGHPLPGVVAARRRHPGVKDLRTRALARDFKNELLAQAAANSWVDPRRGRILFNEWAGRATRVPHRAGNPGIERTIHGHVRPYR
jgi:hypothetical protein